MFKKTFLLAALALSATASADPTSVDPALPTYTPVSAVSGKLNSIGSDTLNNVMALWIQAFRAIYPNVTIEAEGKGSSTAPPALINGTAQLGPMSRDMKPTELDEFEKKFGYKPTQIKVSVDALAVYVHKDSPLECLSLQQVDAIFSSTLKRGGPDAVNWGAVGLKADWQNKPISLYGRNSASGTYGFFKEHVLKAGDFKSTVKEQPGSSSVVQGIAGDLGGIGYSGVGYKTSGVKFVKLSDGGECIEPTPENALSGKYPLARFLYVYINQKPGQKSDALVGEFMRYVLSKQGQQIVIKDGYFPLPMAVAAEGLKQLNP